MSESESSNAAKPNRLRVWIANVVLLLVSTLLTIAAAEIGLRLYFFGTVSAPKKAPELALMAPDPVLGWRQSPNAFAWCQKLDYLVPVQINSMGLRDSEHSYEKPEGVYRIVLLGDSFMEARQVLLEESMAWLVEDKLKDRNVEVINLGVAGYGTAQEYLMLRDEGLKYDPDLVLLAYLPMNDLSDNVYDLQARMFGEDNRRTYGRPYITWNEDDVFDIAPPDYDRAKASYDADLDRLREEDASRGLIENSVTYALYHRAQRLRIEQEKGHMIRFDPNVMFIATLTRYQQDSDGDPVEYAREHDQAWTVTRRMFEATRELAEDHGAKFSLIHVPAKIEVWPQYQSEVSKKLPELEWDYEKPSRGTLAYGEESGVPVLDLSAKFRARLADESAPLHYNRYDDGHWNVRGNRFAAEHTVQFLIDQSLVP